jgi:hypothetical protein
VPFLSRLLFPSWERLLLSQPCWDGYFLSNILAGCGSYLELSLTKHYYYDYGFVIGLIILPHLWKNQQPHLQTLLSIILMGDVVDTICDIVYENNIGGDNKVERDILSKLCEEWEQLERNSTMILDQKLSELMGKNKLLSKDVQEANKVVSNNSISYLCIKLEKLERKLQMVLNYQLRVVRDDNNLLSKELNEATNDSTLQIEQLRMDGLHKLGLSNPKRVRIWEVDEKGVVVPSVGLFDGDTLITFQTFQSDSGLVSADPPSISTVCNGFWGDMKCSSSLKLAEVSRLLDYIYYPLHSGWKFPDFPFLFHKPTDSSCRAISRLKQDGLENVWEPGEYLDFLRFVGRVTIMNYEDWYSNSTNANCLFQYRIKLLCRSAVSFTKERE